MSTREIIDAIDSGDATAMMSAFENAMMSRVATKLDDLRIQTAQSMFKSEAAVTEPVTEPAAE